MPNPDPRFTADEYAARLAKTRAAMEAKGIECLIVSDPSNMHWLTGYDGWSFYVHQAVVVPPAGNPIWYGRGQDAAGAQRTAWLPDADIVGYPDHYVQSTERHPMDYLAGDARRRAASTGSASASRWTTTGSPPPPSPACSGTCPNARFADATGLVNWQRAVKSPAEIGYMRKAARIVEAMHARIAETARVGIRKCDLVAEILAAGTRGVDGVGGDYPAIVPLLPSGARRFRPAPHLGRQADARRARAPSSRSPAATTATTARCRAPSSSGKPTQAFLDAEAATLEGMEAGLAAARPGNTCEDIAKAFFAVLARHGIVKDNRTGYSIGLSYPPDWGERTMSLRPGDRTELRPGMTFHFMTGLWLEDIGPRDHRSRS